MQVTHCTDRLHRFFLAMALVAVIVAVFVVVAVFLLNAWAAAVIVLVVSLIVFQLTGVRTTDNKTSLLHLPDMSCVS